MEYRKGFYEKYYDLRVLVPYGATMEIVVQLVESKIREFVNQKKNEKTRYESTRGKDLPKVILKGLAEDGGLYMPTTIPQFTKDELIRLSDYCDKYDEFTLRILEKWMPELSPQLLRSIIQKAYKDFGPKLTLLNENQFILELFNGPTARYLYN